MDVEKIKKEILFIDIQLNKQLKPLTRKQLRKRKGKLIKYVDEYYYWKNKI